jgi:hypothetical protein
MNVLILVIVFLGIGGFVLQVVLSMLRNKVWGLIFPIIDLVAIVTIIILGILGTAGIFELNFGSILVLYMVIVSVLFVAHSVIYGVSRIIRKSM